MSAPYVAVEDSRVSIRASPNIDILGVKFYSNLTFEDHVLGIVFLVSQRIAMLRLVKRIFVDTSVFFCCYFPFVLPTLEYCSTVWGSAAEYQLQLIERQLYSVAIGFVPIKVSVVVSSTLCGWA